MSKFFFLVLSFFYCLSNTTMAKDTIIWGIDWSPSIDITDSDHPAGISGEILSILEKGLPQYTHEHQKMNLSRIIKSLKNQNNVCNNYLFKNPKREKVGYFSLPVRINLPLRIIMRKDVFNNMGQPTKLSLKTLFKDHQLRGIIENGRSYSVLDPIIKQFSNSIYLNTEVVSSNQLLKMFAFKRLDFFIDYSYAVMDYFHGKPQNHEDQVALVAIEEIFEFAYSYVICPKNDWGKRVIKDVNRVLKKEVPKDSYLETLKIPFRNKHDQVEIEKIYNTWLIKEYEKQDKKTF
jgi:uncharacterized protein (TIGR02285 family)